MRPLTNVDLIAYDLAFERRLARLAKQKEENKRHAQRLAQSKIRNPK